MFILGPESGLSLLMPVTKRQLAASLLSTFPYRGSGYDGRLRSGRSDQVPRRAFCDHQRGCLAASLEYARYRVSSYGHPVRRAALNSSESCNRSLQRRRSYRKSCARDLIPCTYFTMETGVRSWVPSCMARQMSSFLTRWFLSVDVEAAGLGLRSPPSNSTFLARPSLDAPKNLHVVRNMNVADGESIRRDASGYLFRGVLLCGYRILWTQWNLDHRSGPPPPFLTETLLDRLPSYPLFFHRRIGDEPNRHRL